MFSYVNTASVFFLVFVGVVIQAIVITLRNTCLVLACLMGIVAIMVQLAFSGVEAEHHQRI
jgi:hypothetical protein